MIGLKFKLILPEKSNLGFTYIQIVGRVLVTHDDYKHCENHTSRTYNYVLDCITDIGFMQITEEEFSDELSYSIYELDANSKIS
jgi:DNA replication protein DnaD